MDAPINYFIRRAYTSPDVLLDPRDLLGDQDAGPEPCCTAGHG